MSVDPEGAVGGDERPARRKPEARLIIGLVALALVVAFAFANTERVNVDYLIFDRNSRLIYVVLASAVLGALADRLIRLRRRKE